MISGRSMEEEYWILDARNRVVPESDARRWSQWHAADDRREIDRSSWVTTDGDVVTVITMFLGFNATGGHPPALWDTTVYLASEEDPDLGERIEQWHYTSRAAAVKGHADMVRHLGGEDRDHSDGWHKGLYGGLSFIPFALLRILDAMDGRIDNVWHIARRCIHAFW